MKLSTYTTIKVENFPKILVDHNRELLYPQQIISDKLLPIITSELKSITTYHLKFVIKVLYNIVDSNSLKNNMPVTRKSKH